MWYNHFWSNICLLFCMFVCVDTFKEGWDIHDWFIMTIAMSLYNMEQAEEEQRFTLWHNHFWRNIRLVFCVFVCLFDCLIVWLFGCLIVWLFDRFFVCVDTFKEGWNIHDWFIMTIAMSLYSMEQAEEEQRFILWHNHF